MVDSGDVLLGTSPGHATDLAPAASSAYSQSVRIPAATSPGTYFLLVQADALAAVVESDEGHNVRSAALTVTVP